MFAYITSKKNLSKERIVKRQVKEYFNRNAIEYVMEDTEFMQKKNRIKRIYRKGGAETIKRALNGKYVYFDYSTRKGGEAHAIFAWNEKAKVYRYWWFENTGNFLTATCNFVNNETLFLNWHDTLLIQTFKKDGPNKVVLRMEHPNSKGKYETILEVIFTKK
jgi:hypothetical protein